MKVHDVPRGQAASEDSDRITINALPGGKFGFTGHTKNGSVTAHAVSPDEFASEDEALAAAADWAEDNGAEVLYVERPNL